MRKLAPILLFTYNRLKHTQQTVEALKESELAKESVLFVFCDGVKDVYNSGEAKKVRELREYVEKISGFRNVVITMQKENLGLAKSIISGVNSVFKTYQKLIVIEDDVVVGKYFLDYSNEALLRYELNKQVFTVSGYAYNLPLKLSRKKAYFLPTSSNQAWATWKDRWCKVDFDANGYEVLKSNKSLKRKFDLYGGADYSGMLINQMEKNLNSWAIRYRWTQFLNNGLTLFPPQNLVKNIGWDGSGVHCDSYNPYKEKTNRINHKDFLFPNKIEYTKINYIRLLLFFYRVKVKAFVKYKLSSK